MDRRNFFKWLGAGAAAPIAAKAAGAVEEFEKKVNEIDPPESVKHRLIEVEDDWGCSMSIAGYPAQLRENSYMAFTATSDPTLCTPEGLLDAVKQSLKR